MTEKIQYIPARQKNAAVGGHIGGTEDIIDDVLGKEQDQINQETIQALNDRYTKSQTYNKTELDSMITTPNQQYVNLSAEDGDTLADIFDGVTGAADTIYRVGSWDGEQYDATVYSEYAFDGTNFVYLSTKTQIGEVFDISLAHASGGELAKYADLEAALGTDGANVPEGIRKGGMSVKFVQSSDNKYIQARLMANSFTTDITQWQGVDAEPTAGSKNLVESGGVLMSMTKSFPSTTLFDKNSNIVELDNITIDNGVYIKADGSYGYRLDSAITDFVYIKGSSTLKWHGKLNVANINVSAIAFYDENKTFISSVSVGTTGDYTTAQTDIEVSNIPSNAIYVRCTTLSSADIFYIWSNIFGVDLLRYYLQTAINTINAKLAEGYVYAGIATTSTNPNTPSGKVFYIATAAGTYTYFNSLVLTHGINILKYNGTSWTVEQVWGVDNEPTAGSNNLVKSGGVLKSMTKSFSSTTLFDKNSNIVELSDITTANGIYIDKDGELHYNAAFAITDFVYIKGSSTLKWHGYLPVTNRGVAAIAFYNENKTFISSVSVGETGDYTTPQTNIDVSNIPATAVYVRCSTMGSADIFYIWSNIFGVDLLRYYVETALNAEITNRQNADIALQNSLNQKYANNLSQINNIVYQLKLIPNLYDKDNNIVELSDITTANGIYIDKDGELHYKAAFAITNYINIQGCTILKWHGYLPVTSRGVAAIAFYNENKTYISSVSVGETGDYTTPQTDIEVSNIPSNAVYIRCSTMSSADIFYIWSNIFPTNADRYFDGIQKVELMNPVKETAGMASIIHDWGFIGDSLCSGQIAYTKTDSPETIRFYNAYPFSWGQRICKQVGGKGVNYSVGGLTTISWWERYITNSITGWTESGESSIFESDIHSAYMIALGTNDKGKLNMDAGNAYTDIDPSDYNNNLNTFAGNYGKIIQKIRELNNRAPIFCVIYSTMTDAYDTVIKQMSVIFDGVFIIDLRTDFNKVGIDVSSYIYGAHYTTQGYQFLAFALMNELDSIIRKNMSYFNKFALIGTNIQDDGIIW